MGQNRKIYKELIRLLDRRKGPVKWPGQLVIEIGKFFLETPYVEGTLETGRTERLIVNLRGFDCVIFVETTVALACHLKSRDRSFESFQRLLRKIRYRRGRLRGYPSRLHYFSDWIYDNQRKAIVRDVTAEIGGEAVKKAVAFMTTHPDLYPPLRDAANRRRMKSIERTISQRPLVFIPKKVLRRLEHRILDGDLVAITTNVEGLDVQHVGFAARLENRIHLLHASSVEGKVGFSKETLCRHLKRSRVRSGIMVARVSKGD